MTNLCAVLLPGLLIALTGCSSSYNYLRVSSDGAIAERRGRGPAWVAWYRDGEILGAAAAGDPAFPLDRWLPAGEVVDHPNIGQWRRQLADLQAITRKPDAPAADVARAARGFPFEAAIADILSAWVGGRSERAAELLEHTGEVELSDAFAEQLATTARRSNPDDGRVAAWVRALTEADHDEAVRALFAGPTAGPLAAEAALSRLDEYSSRHRSAIFAAAAPCLVRDPDMAFCIVEAADKLPHAEETAAIASLLTGDATQELARQVLRHLDARQSSDRARLFELAAGKCYTDTRGHYAIGHALMDLSSVQRLDAARGVVALPGVSEQLVVMMVDATDSLRSSDREEFLALVLESPQGSSDAVREACTDAARRHLPSRARERILQRLARQR